METLIQYPRFQVLVFQADIHFGPVLFKGTERVNPFVLKLKENTELTNWSQYQWNLLFSIWGHCYSSKMHSYYKNNAITIFLAFWKQLQLIVLDYIVWMRHQHNISEILFVSYTFLAIFHRLPTKSV